MARDQSMYPHTYREQRVLERNAKKNRETALSEGTMNLPPICGWTYMTKINRNQKAIAKSMQAVCWRTAGAGTTHHGKGHCDYHEVDANANIEKTTARAPVQTANAIKHAQAQARFFGNPLPKDPHVVLLDEIARSAQVVAWYEDKLSALREDGSPDDEVLRDWSKQNGYKPSVWIQLYNDERRFLVSTCVAAIKAGVAERKVRIAEQQGRMIAGMMMAFMHDPELGMSPQQLMAAPALIRKHLMSMPHEATEIQLDPEQVMLNATRATKRPAITIIDTDSRESE